MPNGTITLGTKIPLKIAIPMMGAAVAATAAWLDLRNQIVLLEEAVSRVNWTASSDESYMREFALINGLIEPDHKKYTVGGESRRGG